MNFVQIYQICLYIRSILSTGGSHLFKKSGFGLAVLHYLPDFPNRGKDAQDRFTFDDGLPEEGRDRASLASFNPTSRHPRMFKVRNPSSTSQNLRTKSRILDEYG